MNQKVIVFLNWMCEYRKLEVVWAITEGIMLFTLRGKKSMQEMMTIASDVGGQFFISFGADAVEGQCGKWNETEPWCDPTQTDTVIVAERYIVNND